MKMGIQLPNIFFFSSRRRHTRYWRDWSSDVCSSDLGAVSASVLVGADGAESVVRRALGIPAPRPDRVAVARSEERRVGKEGRSRWSPYHTKKIIHLPHLLACNNIHSQCRLLVLILP